MRYPARALGVAVGALLLLVAFLAYGDPLLTALLDRVAFCG